jgi:hypothetical protein
MLKHGSSLKKIVIMGNGPSLKGVDFDLLRSVDTFGINLAYRKYEELDFYPKYYGSFDHQTIDNNKEEFQKLIDDSPIERLFFSKNIFKGEKFQFCNMTGLNTIKNNPIAKDFNNFYYQGNSGTMACQVAIMLGYNKIILIGVDQNYTEKINGTTYNKKGQLMVVDDNIKNENYWFDDYVKKGEIYNMPKKHIYHTPAWTSLPKKTSVDIVNCSPISKLNCFRVGDLETEINF